MKITFKLNMIFKMFKMLYHIVLEEHAPAR